jgi:hypothetical protein
VSFTTDMWSDPDLKQYMAITAHWLELVKLQGGQTKLTLRTDLIGFVRVHGSHVGEKLAKVFFFIINRVRLVTKVTFFYYNYKSLTNLLLDWLGNH